MNQENIITKQPDIKRRRIAFFDYPDVFEDFYPHYGVDQKTFATKWHNTGSHSWLKILQDEVGEVTWYALSIKPQINEANHQYIGCKVKFLPSSWLHRKLWKWFYFPGSSRTYRSYRIYGSFASYLTLLSWPLIKELIKDKPDVFFVQEYCSGRYDILWLFSKLFNTPIVTYHAGSIHDRYFGKRLRSFTLKRADWIFPSGQAEMQRLLQTYKIPKNRMSIIRPPVDISMYQPTSREVACSASGLELKKRYFVFIGRLDDRVKRISSIINVFERLSRTFSDIDLLIVGGGNDEEALKSEANKRAPGRIHFLGWIATDEKKAQVLNCSDCLIMASVSEGFPTVIGEAFACGIPVASSNVGTISDLVIDGTSGWLFPSGDDEAMFTCLKKIAEHPDELLPMKAQVRKLAVQHLSFETITATMKYAFSRLN